MGSNVDDEEIEEFDLDKLMAKNVKGKLNVFGEFELRYIKDEDAVFILNILNEINDDKEFCTKLIHNQLVLPKISFSKFKSISDDELEELALYFLKNEYGLCKYFQEINDEEFFKKFRLAVNKGLKVPLESLTESIGHINQLFTDFNRKFSGLSINLASTLEQFSTYTLNISPLVNENRLNALNLIHDLNVYPVIENISSLTAGLSQYYSTANYFSEFIENTVKLSELWTEQRKSLFDSYKNYFQNFENVYAIAEETAIEILRACEWPMTPSLPKNFLFKIVITAKGTHNLTEAKKAINKLFFDYFSSNNFENLERFVDRWEAEGIFKPMRIKILRDCISILKTPEKGTNPANLIVPTLIAQIDGVRTEFMKKSGLYVEKTRWKDSDGRQIVWKNWYENQTSEMDLLNLTNDIFLNVLWEKAYQGEPIKTSIIFNRHKIMHGEYTNYGTKYNIIRAFLILDFLAILIEENQNLDT